MEAPDAPGVLGGEPGPGPAHGVGEARLVGVRGQLFADPAEAPDGTGLEAVPGDALARPAAPAEGFGITERIQRGQDVRAQIGDAAIEGSLRGYDYRGRPVIETAAQERRVAAWDRVEVKGPALAVVRPTDELAPGTLQKPPAKLRAALDASFDTKVAGDHTAREYIDAIHAEGYFVYLTGGAIRDAVYALALDPEAPQEVILDKLKDIDIVTTAPPPVVRRIAERIAPEYKAGAVWSPPIVDQFGSVLIGGPKAGLPNPEGLDVTSMRSDGAFEEQAYHRDTNEKAFPYTFDHSLLDDTGTRDFACNALYYDPLNGLLVDPTGRGIEDAQKNRLHVSRAAALEKDDNIALRFWKFRIRGFKADRETRGLIRSNANQLFWAMPRWKLVLNLARICPKDAVAREDIAAFFEQLGRVMKEDGCGRLFDRRVAPQLDRVAEKIERRRAKGVM